MIFDNIFKSSKKDFTCQTIEEDVSSISILNTSFRDLTNDGLLNKIDEINGKPIYLVSMSANKFCQNIEKYPMLNELIRSAINDQTNAFSIQLFDDDNKSAGYIVFIVTDCLMSKEFEFVKQHELAHIKLETGDDSCEDSYENILNIESAADKIALVHSNVKIVNIDYFSEKILKAVFKLQQEYCKTTFYNKQSFTSLTQLFVDMKLDEYINYYKTETNYFKVAHDRFDELC